MVILLNTTKNLHTPILTFNIFIKKIKLYYTLYIIVK